MRNFVQSKDDSTIDNGNSSILLRETKCLACGSNKYKTYGYKEGYRLTVCRICGHLWVNPTPAYQWVKDGYSRDNTEFVPHEDYALFLTESAWSYANKCTEVILDLLKGTTPGQLCDVGCGIGIFAKRALEQGWSVVGIEPGPWGEKARKYGIQVIRTFLKKQS